MPRELKETDQRSEDFIDRPFPDTDLGEADEPASRQADKPTSQPADESASRQDGQSASRPADKPTGRSADEAASRLAKQIQFMVGALPPHQGESLSEKTNGYISARTDRALRESLDVLKRRYGKDLTKSLVYEHLLRWALRDMQDRAEESLLVQLLDRHLGQ